MLRKLIKYEILADWKKYGIVSAALLLISITMLVIDKTSQRIVNSEFINFVNEILALAFGTIVVCAIAMLFVFSATRFYKSFIRDEGYLTHTLPVHTWQLIASKIIAVYIWFIGLIAILAICGGIAMGKPLWLFRVIQNGSEIISLTINSFGEEAAQSLIQTFIEVTFLMILVPAIYMARICLCFALGNLFSRNKLAMSVLMFFAVSFVERIITSFAAFFIFADLITSSMEASDELVFAASVNAIQISLIFSIIVMAGSLIVSERIFAKKLNLE